MNGLYSLRRGLTRDLPRPFFPNVPGPEKPPSTIDNIRPENTSTLQRLLPFALRIAYSSKGVPPVDISPQETQSLPGQPETFTGGQPLFEENPQVAPPFQVNPDLIPPEPKPPTGQYDYWKTPIIGGKEGAGGMPLDLGVTLAGTLAHAIAPDEWSGRAGAGLAQLGSQAYGQRMRYEEAAPLRGLQERYYGAQIKKLEMPEMPEITGNISPVDTSLSSTGFGYLDKQGNFIAPAPAPKETAKAGKWYQDTEGNWKHLEAGKEGMGLLPQTAQDRYEDMGHGQMWDKVDKKIIKVPVAPREPKEYTIAQRIDDTRQNYAAKGRYMIDPISGGVFPRYKGEYQKLIDDMDKDIRAIRNNKLASWETEPKKRIRVMDNKGQPAFKNGKPVWDIGGGQWQIGD